MDPSYASVFMGSIEDQCLRSSGSTPIEDQPYIWIFYIDHDQNLKPDIYIKPRQPIACLSYTVNPTTPELQDGARLQSDIEISENHK